MEQKRYGLLGRKLGHSWSPQIHAALGCEAYTLFEREPEDLAEFLSRADIGGLNVTIPYKRDVMAYCDVIDETAKAIGSVNTLVRRADGKLYAWNKGDSLHEGAVGLPITTGRDGRGEYLQIGDTLYYKK